VPRLIVFSQVTLDGYFAGPKGDISWAHKQADDAEWNAFVAANASGDGALLFGRITYEMMVSYWPTPLATQNDPAVAAGMNRRRKIVFSRTMDRPSWNNTTVESDLIPAVQRMKRDGDSDMAILGSGTIASQLTAAGLIDEYQIVINPVALGRGRTLFEGMHQKLDLRLTNTRAFANGNVLALYEPA
jgi:dihydrofolate reductase